ncbi:PREDICTED: uncharacterized protein LOC104814148 [Tarenaya hassleriana]|uniref:uncharacterized protein LOC104814148 n=1 Tax=Tarenaya hassleriana TaxID=28532 RepID=UPI00053C6DAE|nr:PREDICTED: uncharacterized protein LOC104814148 [Tarenaya hassleriana]XP_010540339.1 PREDICTED: uncharacterized protein LOC104814148 [Tarenaya hassleriana]XP_019058165.1 PREDICTED: uncharacterized protein LOC104814148 [Tarenaya hassleriana]
MECNRKMAMRAKELAEEKLRAEDFIGARQLAMKAQQLFPELEKLMQLVAVCDVHYAALNKIAGLENWYAILQLNRFADEAAIKKQYRKLVLLLHPDKNKFAGAEEAFKLIGEAYGLLADQTKRLEYDIKYRVFSQINASIQMNRKSYTNSGRQYEPENSEVNRKPTNFVFWTRCEHCGFWWRILRVYMNTSMQCSSCQRIFFAVETRSYGVSPTSAPRQFPRQNEVPNQGSGNVPLWNSSAEPTGGRSGNAPAEMDTNPNERASSEPMNFVFWTCCGHCGFRCMFLREHMNTSMQCSSCQRTFFAVEIGCYGVSPRSAPRQFSRQNEVPNQGPGNVPLQNRSAVPAEGRSGNTPAEMDTNPTEPANSEPMKFVFWTCCGHCGFRCTFLRVYMNTSMQCSSCQRTFFAVETGSYGVSPTSAPRQFPKQNEVPNQGPGNVPLRNSSAEPTGGQSGNVPTEMDTNQNEPANSEPMKFVFWACCGHCGFRSTFTREHMNTALQCSSCQRTFFAVEAGPYGVSPRSAPRRFPEVSNQGPGNVPLRNSSSEPTRGRSGNASTGMDTNPNEPANSEPMNFVFLTCCGHCGFRCMFLREYMNTSMPCSNCQRLFVAVETGTYGVSPRSAPYQFRRKNEVPCQGPGNVPLRNSSPQPTGGRSGNAPVKMDTNAMKTDQIDDTEVRKPGTEKGIANGDAEVSKAEDSKGATMSNAEVPKAKAVKWQYEVRESEGGEAKPKPDVTNPKGDKEATVKRTAEKSRKIVEESSESFEIDGFDNVGSVNAADGNKKMSSLRRERKVSCGEDGGDGNILSPPTKTLKLHIGFKSDAEEAFPSSRFEKIDSVSKANSENPKSEEFPDPDFSNFDEKKGGFSVNQVWALKDSLDSMPWFYARMFTAPLNLQMTCLEALPVTKNEIRIPVSCGKFKSGVTEETDDFGTFSHQVHCIEQGSHHSIYPQKGETWAVFRDWEISWNTDPAKHKEPYEYEFVEVLTDFMETPDDDNGICGIGVYYLEKVEGFVSLFVRAKHRKVLACIFEPREMCRFSHKVPSFRTTGTEGEGDPPGSFELDPSALPKDIFETDPRKDDAETGSQNLDGTAGGESVCSRKRRRDIERENGSIAKVPLQVYKRFTHGEKMNSPPTSK